MQRLSFLFAILVLSAACINASKQPNGHNQKDRPPPVETRNANSNFKPLHSWQTRAPGASTTSDYSVSKIYEGLDRPWDIELLPDGRFIITEKGGTMRIMDTAGVVSAAITGLPEVNSSGQGGLLGLALDPDFAKNRMLFWTFSEDYNGGTVTSVARGKLNASESGVTDVRIIYRALPAYDGVLHYGSRIVIDRQGLLYVSTGERSDKRMRMYAQSLESGLGKILRITKEGDAPSGNPFSSRQGALPEIYSYGHRNVQGLALHPATGDLWSCEMGPRGGDELNLIKPGVNYGWPVITYGIEYSGFKVGDGLTKKEGMEQPVYYWDPVLSPSGMTFYNSNRIPEWRYNLFLCGLNSNHIARLILKDNIVVGEERLLQNENQRFRDIVQGKDGALYSITDAGNVYRIGPGR